MSDRQERIWRCDCGAGHFLSIQYYGGGLSEVGGYLEIDDNGLKMWRSRLKVAREVLRNGHAETNVGVLLDEKTAREIAAALMDFADREAENRPPPVPEDGGEL